jgi:hypothetical protein
MLMRYMGGGIGHSIQCPVLDQYHDDELLEGPTAGSTSSDHHGDIADSDPDELQEEAASDLELDDLDPGPEADISTGNHKDHDDNQTPEDLPMYDSEAEEESGSATESEGSCQWHNRSDTDSNSEYDSDFGGEEFDDDDELAP